jgi:hypothetical protein
MAKTPKTPSSSPASGKAAPGKSAGKPGKPGKAPKDPASPSRIAQIREAFRLTRERDNRLIPIMAATFVVVFAIFLVLGLILGSLIPYVIFGVIGGLLVAFVFFGRRARPAMYGEIEGQPGAAAAVISSLRGDWRLTPNVAITRNSDVVHRVVGKPGVILVGEGSNDRLEPLIADQQKRINRVAAGTPVTVILVGNEKGQVPLGKLERKMTRLPRTFKGATVDQIDGRMRALGGLNIPIPKGPMPKGVRVPKGARPPR